MSHLLTLEEVAERLGKTPRWLRDWLHRFPADHAGRAFYMQAGNGKLFTDADVNRISHAIDPFDPVTPPEGAPFSATAGFLYVVEIGGFVKIGWTRDVIARLGQLQVGSPHKLDLLAVALGTPKDERQLHERFKSLRTRGEWFQPTPELRRRIKAMRNAPLTSAAVNEWKNKP